VVQLFISGRAQEISGFKGRGMDAEKEWVQQRWGQIMTRVIWMGEKEEK